ncbi:protein of unknown function [Streptococcus thermophilus]|uniref:CAAX prenyl protease 2/Lysostaphin resistance protein A-like domain-containing protein n=1 Tax=Streptococcus thermophilus TaxID=1308 RepID=A0A7U7C4A1_STRTR|nr:protein of unknown function [Streptococcus thermophilus]CAD0147111.1 protein of unknown function [Streptococcus thermophilus]CAD0150776.1 protein of unknown function [Streptococcus thermophilus]CAD0152889.1 protein of unknown function [Streptococcus thermophilus]
MGLWGSTLVSEFPWDLFTWWLRVFCKSGLFLKNLYIYILFLIPFWFIQGGTEELVTRGWLFQTVTSKLNLSLGIAISSSLFSILHLGNQGVTAFVSYQYYSSRSSHGYLHAQDR